MVNTVYSIGYYGFPIDDFIRTLKKYKISLVVDVRSSPFSTHFPEYNRDVLDGYLIGHGIQYRNYANEFGARQENHAYYSKEGYLDFECFSKSEQFISGVTKLCDSMSKNHTFVLMCAEKDPIACHRTILVSRAFFDRGYNVIHLLSNGETITQETINMRLLDKFYPDRNQTSLFEKVQDDSTLLDLAYKQQNAEIGYRMEE
jgi:uncharacterized protein (DUF488 family)